MKLARTSGSSAAGTTRRGPRRLKAVPMLPTMFTLGNLLCGFAAIHFALEAMYGFGSGTVAGDAITASSRIIERMFPSYLSIGAGLIIAGIIFDSFDGLVARLTRSTTDFGGQLDSLADVVTCGVAPATLVLALLDETLRNVAVSLSPISDQAWGRLVWVSGAVYVACAAIRLARFNVEHAKVDHDPSRFRGLPSPGAAAIIVSYLIFHEQAREYGVAIPPGYRLAAISPTVLSYVAPLLLISCGLLMVSRVPYAKLSAALHGRRPFWQLGALLVAFAIFWSFKSFSLVCIATAYGLSGPVRLAWRRRRGKDRHTDAPSSAEDRGTDSSGQPPARLG